jgi:hypothetical protein
VKPGLGVAFHVSDRGMGDGWLANVQLARGRDYDGLGEPTRRLQRPRGPLEDSTTAAGRGSRTYATASMWRKGRPRSRMVASVPRVGLEATGIDDQQRCRSRLLLRDEGNGLRVHESPATRCRVVEWE